MRLDPRSHILVVLSAGGLAALVEHPYLLLPFLFWGLGSVVAQLSAWQRIVQGGLVAILMVWASVSSQAIFYADFPRTVIFELWGVAIYEEGIAHGFWQSIRFLTLAILGVQLCLRLSSAQLVNALNRLWLPQGLALMLAVAIRFVPIIWSDMRLVRRARRQRGVPMRRLGVIGWIQTERRLLVPVILRSWRRSHILAESLDERGYDPSLKREALHPLRFGLWDWLLALGLAGLVLGTATAHLLYQMYLWELAYLPELRWLMRITRHWL